MTLVQAELNIIRKAQNSANLVLGQREAISQIDVFYNGDPDYNTTITQQDIDDNFPGSGLTVAILGDAIYALNQAKIAADNAEVALAILGNLP